MLTRSLLTDARIAELTASPSFLTGHCLDDAVLRLVDYWYPWYAGRDDLGSPTGRVFQAILDVAIQVSHGGAGGLLRLWDKAVKKIKVLCASMNDQSYRFVVPFAFQPDGILSVPRFLAEVETHGEDAVEALLALAVEIGRPDMGGSRSIAVDLYDLSDRPWFPQGTELSPSDRALMSDFADHGARKAIREKTAEAEEALAGVEGILDGIAAGNGPVSDYMEQLPAEVDRFLKAVKELEKLVRKLDKTEPETRTTANSDSSPTGR